MEPVQQEKNQLDQRVTAKIKLLLDKTPEELTAADREFLRARSSYLGRSARQKFAAVLKEQPVKEQQKEESETSAEDDGEDEVKS